jgi:hypothetical protein
MITEEELAKLITALNKAGTPEVYKAFEGWFDYAVLSTSNLIVGSAGY